MDPQTQKFKFKLGLFITGGLTLFVLAIFIIGKQKNLFNPVFKLTSTFSNVSGLQVGNNIRFSGINVGTVDNIVIINDTTVRVDLIIKKEVWQFIKSDCKVTLGSEGIIGDKLIIITPGSSDAPLAKEGQYLTTIETIETNAIMARLDVTTANIENISKQIYEITDNINSGNGTLSRLIQDPILAENLSQTIANLNLFSRGLTGSDVVMASLKVTARNAEDFSHQLAVIMNKISNGDGTLGRLIQDSTLAGNLNQTILNFKKSSNGLTGTDTVMAKLNVIASNAEILSKQLTEMMYKINKGNGTLGRLIRDTILAENLNQTLINLKKSSKGLDENMTAAKHNFFFRGYFQKKAKEAAAKKEVLEKAEKKNNLLE
ncbi:MAG: MlaD family protein [Bacteroidales bacterium]|nr:MlaD family protein [Bacteroidales bacterium]